MENKLNREKLIVVGQRKPDANEIKFSLFGSIQDGLLRDCDNPPN